MRKVPTGIPGLDEITYGGLPAGRPTLVCGGPGSGKTLLGITFLVNGIREFGEPGVLMSFEQNAEELAQDVGSLGYDLASLVDDRKLVVDYVHVDRSEIEETGEYDLEGLFVRLEHAVNSVGARRVVLDTIESLFAGLENETILRAELRRLFRWLRDRNLTAVITGEKGENHADPPRARGVCDRRRHPARSPGARSDFDAPPSCRQVPRIPPRHQRVSVSRSTQDGVSVLPVTSLDAAAPGLVRARLEWPRARSTRCSAARASIAAAPVLVSGTSGTGKTTLAAHFVDAACKRGDRSLYFLFEESPQQMLRNMRSCGIDLGPCVDAGLLQFHADRPSRFGLETHLVAMHRAVERSSAPAWSSSIR